MKVLTRIWRWVRSKLREERSEKMKMRIRHKEKKAKEEGGVAANIGEDDQRKGPPLTKKHARGWEGNELRKRYLFTEMVPEGETGSLAGSGRGRQD